MLTDKGQLNDRGFNELAYNGLKRAERELEVQGRVLQAATAADYVPNMASLVRQDYDLIIGVGFAQGDAVAKAASRFPDTKFEIIDVDQSGLAGQAGERRRAALQGGAGRLPRRVRGRRWPRSGVPAPTSSAPSAA